MKGARQAIRGKGKRVRMKDGRKKSSNNEGRGRKEKKGREGKKRS